MLVSVYLPVTPHYYLIGLIATVVGLLSKVNKNKAAVTVTLITIRTTKSNARRHGNRSQVPFNNSKCTSQ